MNRFNAVLRYLDDRLGLGATLGPLLEHPSPRVDWWYVLGSATLVAFTVQVVTGVALAFSYVPTPDHAYESLEFITHGAILGSVVRGIHYWGATAMVVLVAAHMFHVLLYGSFKYPREMNWLSGTFLLLFTLGMAFTGQLLRWNQDAYWAVVVGASQAGRAPFVGEWLAQILVAGQTVGGATLTRFYATHVFLIPAAMFVLIGIHLYLVIHHGISELPRPGVVVDKATYRHFYHELLRKEGEPFWPDYAWKDVVFALAVGSIVVLLAIWPGPPELGKQADPTIIEAYPRPDWYFLWYFALLALLPSGIEDAFIIGFPLLLGVVMIALPFVAPTGERSPIRRPWTIGITGFALVSIGVLVYLGLEAPWSPVFDPAPLPPSVVASVSGDARRGADLIQSKGCINCHTIAGVGGRRGPDLSSVGSRLSADQTTWRILAGGNNMPAYGAILSPQDVQAIVAFLQQRRGASR